MDIVKIRANPAEASASSSGAAPAGVRPGDERGAASYVRQMFGHVAPRYDLVNHVLSFHVDRYWRRVTAQNLRDVIGKADARILDLCCGTGDLMLALNRVHGGPVFGSDFCRPMLEAAKSKLGPRGRLIEADTLRLPLPDAAFDAVTIGFGLRNLANYRAGIREMYRLLRAGGKLAVLDFSRPRGRLIGPLYGFYFRNVLPRLGGAISGAGAAYRYLQESVDYYFTPEQLAAALRETGFRAIQWRPLTGGIAVLHVAQK